MMNRNKKFLDSFTKYCLEHPEERGWQALRNWSEYSFIYGVKPNTEIGDIDRYEDTFYKEDK